MIGPMRLLRLARLRGTLALVAAAVALVLIPNSAAVADVPLPSGTTIAVTGSNRALYVRGPAQLGFSNWGGQLVNAPAIAYTNGITHVIGIGTNNILYHRTAETGWHRLMPDNYYCTDVSASADNGIVYVACRGGNGALYTFQFAGTNQTPFVTTLVKLGGWFMGAVGVVITDAGPTYYVTGGSYLKDEGGQTYEFNVWYRTATGPWNRYDTYCQGPPAVSSTATTYYFACRYTPRQVLVESWRPGGDKGTWVVYALPGSIQGNPALAPIGNGNNAQLYVAGTDTRIFTKYVDVEKTTTALPWTDLGGRTIGGVSASTTLYL